MEDGERLSAVFLALGDPTRRALLTRLAAGEATVGELAEPLPISQPAVSRHIKVLVAAGLIVQRVDGSRRPCRLADGAFEEADAFLASLRDAVDTQYAGLDQLLQRMASPSTKSGRGKRRRKG
ncbi:MAG: metalloregulator ArsR/SmtB family transcription factor [Myxococcota bacterium]